MRRSAATSGLLALLAGCATAPYAPEGQSIPTGRWGGEQVALDIAEDGSGVIALPCASAAFKGPVTLDIGGHFLTPGTYTQASGAPPLGPPTPVPANISGRLDADGTLWLDLSTSEGPRVKRATLRRGREPVLHFCP